MQNKRNICPMCGKPIIGYPAISRKDNKTEICSDCGTLEGFMDYKNHLAEEPTEVFFIGNFRDGASRVVTTYSQAKARADRMSAQEGILFLVSEFDVRRANGLGEIIYETDVRRGYKRDSRY